MLKNSLPWRFLIKRSAKRFGTIDPVDFLAKLRRFSQPSEVQEPIELLRAGIIFHARGLINTKAIQYNLDWVWPYWVEKQFNPNDPSFIPRGFSFSHINMTHRNWTAVGLPDLPLYPIIDPRGMVTPLHDSWSLDFWIIRKSGDSLIPSKLQHVDQKLIMEESLMVKTFCNHLDMNLVTTTEVVVENGKPEIQINLKATSDKAAYLVATVRPYNPEGVQFVDTIEWESDPKRLVINKDTKIIPNEKPGKVMFSDYYHGDVLHKVHQPQKDSAVDCKVGMATAAMLFDIEEEGQKEIVLRIPLQKELQKQRLKTRSLSNNWTEKVKSTAKLSVPDDKIQFLYDAAVRTLLLLSADKVVPGPYTYKRFWIRDAAYMINTLLTIGCKERAGHLLEHFFDLQKRNGYFQSQEGEWDSNGQTLWILARYHQLTGEKLPADWLKLLPGLSTGFEKRVHETNKPHDGLLPPGFSAEHLGPNDYFYWDDFWSVGGLKAIAAILENYITKNELAEIKQLASDFEQSIYKSIDGVSDLRKKGGIPASPYRRMDSGAIGSLVADYPLQLTTPESGQINHTVEFLLNNCFQSGGFFQDMIHSGINAYLSLEIAQTLLRKEDERYRDIIAAVADLATSTGQWPEAIHPLTLGGCMGDGQHGWAAADWIMMIRNLFIREEGDKLIIGSGIFPKWLNARDELYFDPTMTPFGKIAVKIYYKSKNYYIDFDVNWHDNAPVVEVNVAGYQKEVIREFTQPYQLKES